MSVTTSWKWMAVFLIPLLSGCFATSTMVGKREPDLAQLQTAQQRSQVERLLGKRLWCAGSAGGFTYDIYQFQAKRQPRPIMGTVGLGLDFLSVGLTEFNARDIETFAPVKQLAVTYDAQGRVHFVSPPWSVDMGGPGSPMRCLLPEESGVPITARPPPLPRQAGAASEIATLKFPIVGSFFKSNPNTIDGRQIKGHVVEVPPGQHTVVYGPARAEVELLAGRVYRLREKCFYPGYQQSLNLIWIEDEDSDETIFCTHPSLWLPAPH